MWWVLFPWQTLRLSKKIWRFTLRINLSPYRSNDSSSNSWTSRILIQCPTIQPKLLVIRFLKIAKRHHFIQNMDYGCFFDECMVLNWRNVTLLVAVYHICSVTFQRFWLGWYTTYFVFSLSSDDVRDHSAWSSFTANFASRY